MKVYYSKCKYYSDLCSRGYDSCKAPLNIGIKVNTYLMAEIEYRKPSELNKNNDCKWYKEMEIIPTDVKVNRFKEQS